MELVVVVVVVGVGLGSRSGGGTQQPITCLGDDSPLLAGAHVRRQHICCEEQEHASAGLPLTAPPYSNHTVIHATCTLNKLLHMGSVSMCQ